MSEPLYTFVKGEGWVPTSTTLPLWLKGYEIQVGDVLDMYRMAPGDSDIPFHTRPGLVKSITQTTVGETYFGHSGEFQFNPDKPREWRVIERNE